MKKTIKLDVFLHIRLHRMTKKQRSKWFKKHDLVLYDGRILRKECKKTENKI